MNFEKIKLHAENSGGGRSQSQFSQSQFCDSRSQFCDSQSQNDLNFFLFLKIWLVPKNFFFQSGDSYQIRAERIRIPFFPISSILSLQASAFNLKFSSLNNFTKFNVHLNLKTG